MNYCHEGAALIRTVVEELDRARKMNAALSDFTEVRESLDTFNRHASKCAVCKPAELLSEDPDLSSR